MAPLQEVQLWFMFACGFGLGACMILALRGVWATLVPLLAAWVMVILGGLSSW